MRIAANLRYRAWAAAYTLEELREAHAAQRRYASSALCCIGLALMSVIGTIGRRK